MSCAQVLCSVLRSQCESDIEIADEQIFVDFKHAQPTEIEQEVYQLMEKVLEQAEFVLDDLSQYGSGATDAIHFAIRNPENSFYQDAAWCVLLKSVRKLKTYYELSVRLKQAFPLLLWELVSGPLAPSGQLESCQALSKQLAQTLDFVLKFDDLKLATSALQNDFSYYRRTMSKKSLTFGVNDSMNENDGLQVMVPSDLANTISFFYADATPMLTALTNATISFVHKHPDLPVENTTDTLATMANVCRSMVETEEFLERMSRDDDTRLFCMRVMVGSLILFDHVHPVGAFVRGSAIDVSIHSFSLYFLIAHQYFPIHAIIGVLKNEYPHENTAKLLNALRYTTKHFSDSSTPKTIRSMLL